MTELTFFALGTSVLSLPKFFCSVVCNDTVSLQVLLPIGTKKYCQSGQSHYEKLQDFNKMFLASGQQ